MALRLITYKGWYAIKQRNQTKPNNRISLGVVFSYFLILGIVFSHHHHDVPLAWISLTLSRHFSLLFIAFGMFSGLHPVSSHIWCMYVRAGHPAFARPFLGVHMSTSLMSSSLLLQQCPACLVLLKLISHLARNNKMVKTSQKYDMDKSWINIVHNLVSVLLWTPTHGRAKAGRPARAYIQ